VSAFAQEARRRLAAGMRVVAVLASAAAFTAAFGHFAFQYLRLGDGFSRLILR
jgi:hypothetical protein